MHCCLRFVYQSQSIFTILNSETKSLSQNAVQNVENKWRKTKMPCFSVWDVFENTSTANIKLYKKNTPKDRGF